jgi:hypothetical protein
VRVRARRLHDGRGVSEEPQEGKSRHRSSDGGRSCRSYLSFERTAAEDLSGPPAVGQKTCPAPAGKHPKTCVVDAVVRARIGPFPRPPITQRPDAADRGAFR